MIQVHVPNFFYFTEILKMTEVRPKNCFFGPEIPKDSKKAKTEEDSYSEMSAKIVDKGDVQTSGLRCAQCTHISVYW